MTSSALSKEVLLKNILAKAFDNKLIDLEKRTKEHIESLQSTKKIFSQFTKKIQTIVKNVSITKDKKQKEKEKQKTQPQYSTSKSLSSLRPHQRQMISSQTLPTISLPLSRTNRSVTFSSKPNRRPISKSLTEKPIISKNKSAYLTNVNKPKSLFTRNTTPHNIHKYNNSNVRYVTTSPSTQIIKSPYVRSKSTKHSPNTTKKPQELQKELLSIQQQIKNVEYNLLTTEKAIEHQKTFNNSDIYSLTTPNNQIKYKKSVYHTYLQNKNDIIKHIIKYLNDIDKFTIICSSKYYFKDYALSYIDELIAKTNNKMDKAITNIQSKDSQFDIHKDYNDFTLSRGALKATDLLDQELYNKLFTKEELDESMKEIIYIYKIFYQLILKEDFVNVKDDALFWKKNCEFILKESNDKIGTFFVSSAKQFCFDTKNVYKLKQIIEPIKNKMLPSYFSKICGTTSLVTFILKDALEFCGALVNEKKTHPEKIVENLKYEKDVVLNKLKLLKNKFIDLFN